MTCLDCQRVKDVFKDLKTFVAEVPDEEEQKTKLAIIKEAEACLYKFKAHRLRTRNQEKGATDIINSLEPGEVYITIDWAMKFLPAGARETQAEFYGKRGISWMIAVAIMKTDTTPDASGITYKYMERV